MTAVRERPAARIRALADFYVQAAKLSAVQQFSYRASNYLFLVGMLAEPVIYLVVWRTIAEAKGGSVGGYTAGSLAAYYILWTLVRNMNLVYAPTGFEWRIASGRMSGRLLLPVHPIHYDLAGFAGAKVVWIALWLPIAALLTWLFQPALDVGPVQVAVFLVAIWGAFTIRSLFLWVLGLVTFWTTRAGALFELYLVFELLLSGRLVPLTLLPGWAQEIADHLPFKWTFGFPIDSLVSPRSTAQLLGGLGMQALWIAVGAGLVAVVWKRAVRRYSGVGA
ncbi:ABC-2 family transporter protein [Umezawaea sp. Da 62-37]|uniref:ABC transporter permease n=1 Tax=Umezawaea sp. Da 62-37 TaxID=3075927 RepID=UPI0028F73E57|nr:ABC-2 family transporter protein [Umezawaea sp. Da 62-37]WNV87679.1 ABC-2 family transporter protein [Umezawaea sp. Da 62-37]